MVYIIRYGLYHQIIYSMLFYLKNCGIDKRKTKPAHIDCCLSLIIIQNDIQNQRINITNSGADFWQNHGFNDKSVKTSKNV